MRFPFACQKGEHPHRCGLSIKKGNRAGSRRSSSYSSKILPIRLCSGILDSPLRNGSGSAG